MTNIEVLPPAIVLTGPTAAGKTDVALAVAERFPVGLVSMDSVQVYRGLDIGSAKPGAEVLARFPHALIDIREPEDTYSAADFAADAAAAMRSITASGKCPLLVGGTVLYLRALRAGLDPLPPRDERIRRRLDEEASRSGWPGLHARLARVDPESARRIRPRDAARIQRALEIHEITGRPRSALTTGRTRSRMAGELCLVLVPAHRHILHERIRGRLDAMLAGGFLDEVRGLMARPGLTAAHASMRAVGYRQAWRHLSGETDSDTFLAHARAATRQLAKRQLTGLRHYPGALWYDAEGERTIDRIFSRVEEFLKSQG